MDKHCFIFDIGEAFVNAREQDSDWKVLLVNIEGEVKALRRRSAAPEVFNVGLKRPGLDDGFDVGEKVAPNNASRQTVRSFFVIRVEVEDGAGLIHLNQTERKFFQVCFLNHDNVPSRRAQAMLFASTSTKHASLRLYAGETRHRKQPGFSDDTRLFAGILSRCRQGHTRHLFL